MRSGETDTKLNANKLKGELEFTASRSEGPGGQNVNKVNSKITLRWDIPNSPTLTEEEKHIISGKLSSFITKDGILVLSAQDNRSQLQNKEAVLMKLDHLLQKAFAVKKQRKATKPSKSASAERLKKKKQHSEKKKWRQKSSDE